MIDLIKSFMKTFSVSSGENDFAGLIESYVAPYADSVMRDPVGNLIVFRKGADSGKKLMTASHMDEIGFIVTAVEDNGMIRVSNIGGVDPVASSFTPVVFAGGTKGVLVIEDGTSNADISNKKLFVDIGAESASKAKRRVHVGELAACAPSFVKLSANRYASKAFDDKIGCAVNAYACINAKTPAYDTYFVFTVQEEVGCRGSKPASFSVAPDYSIALDVTSAVYTGNPDKLTVKLGEGAAIKIKDNSVVCSPILVERLKDLAESNGIKYQYEILPYGGTDTSQMQSAGSGSCAGCISIPTRYVHSPVETVDLRDVKACADLLIAFIEQGV